MAYSNYGTCTSGTVAQDILSVGHNFYAINFLNESDTAMRIRIGGTATSTTGTNIPAGGSRVFKNLGGQQVSMLCATTGKVFSWTEDVP